MAVDSEIYWSMLALCGVGLVVAAVWCVLDWRRGAGDPTGDHDHGHEVLMYLNGAVVMDLLQYRGGVALKRLVEHYSRDSAEGRLEVGHGPVGVGGGKLRDREVRQSYEVDEKPITAIREVVQKLEEADAIVYADLEEGTVRAHRTLSAYRARRVKLSGSRMFVSIAGPFEEYKENDGSDQEFLRLRVPYPDGDGHIRVKIARTELREPAGVPEGAGSFPARVLGKVEGWDEREGVLKMWALAMFR
ncbi:hypothetical protein [Nocardia bovistercoris]|uniref:Uncharacterized protein n=1 Tax=Nocardia bovistercoris TaxID=2785916 RepID=A0A931N3T2_9NOCA|nr:hypothetical protein [Nocardia bovistercoris]MBH0778057.1 hypothetical protein [Nocardia bovistercoris]